MLDIYKLLNSMTIEQKVAQIIQIPYAHITQQEAEKWAKLGIGSFLHVLGEDAKNLQKIAVEHGHKIPLLFGIDAIHGHCLNRKATVFPTQLSMACTYNPELVKKMAEATAKEVSADGLHWTFSPLLCLARDVRWGRTGETFGEDPYLTGELGAAMVEGYQGVDNTADTSIIACAKHYIGYGESTGGRDSYDTSVTYRKVKDVFLPPFERVVNAGCATIMTAYGSIDGTPCTADKKLLKNILKNQLKFQGFIVTDWKNVSHLIYTQKVSKNTKHASKLALESGNDMMMNAPEFFDVTVEMVKNGEIDETLLNDAVLRILKVKEQFGLFENPFKQANISYLGCNEHLEIAKKLAQESVVLLKNNNILPIKSKTKILLVGESADDIRCNYGDWTYFSHPLPNYESKKERPYITLYEGLKEIAGKNSFELVYEKGCNINSEDLESFKKALEKAEECDLIIFSCGDNIQLAAEGIDRADTTLPQSQKKLFSALKKINKPIISVLISTKPLCIPEIDDASEAVLTNFNGGMFGGGALAEAIFGNINPCGKLPISFPYHVGQQPTYYNQLPGWHCESYIDMPKNALYSFGKGLSYTKFEYSNISFDVSNLLLEVTIKNIGDFDGSEIVQVYINDLISSVQTPIKKLIAFKKIKLLKGNRKKVDFKFELKDFSFINLNEERVVEDGEFEIMVGGSSENEDLEKVVFSLEESIIF